ncbi:hypothetical protein pEaSNUABM11_00034 [Erwinia phage pEa_SNUABM_11]|nr:hypothetical protein pEaSNUABM11_00034 [Erwinia phage pEa_SNUABM_11]
MFSRADLNQAAVKGIYADPSAIQIAAAVKNNQQRIRNFLERSGTRTVSNHLILELITAVGFAGDATYDDVEWACLRAVTRIGNALKLSSVGEFGQVHNGKFITGQDEIISLVARPVDPYLSFQDYTPAVYLYHEYTNLNWQLGTDKPSGVSIIEINLVALLWQYTKGVEYYQRTNTPISSPVYAQQHVVYRMLPSYMDIAFLNIHRRVAMGLEVEKDAPTRTVPVPPLRDLAVRNATKVREALLRGSPLPGVVLRHVPQFFSLWDPSDAVDRVLFRESGSTLQSNWPRDLVNWHWALFCYQYDNPAMQKDKSNLKVDLERFEDLRVFEKLKKPVQNHYKHALLFPLYRILEE